MDKEVIDSEVAEFAEQLFNACRTGKTEFVTSAIDQGVPVNLSDAKGNTLLMLAAYNGQAELVEALLSRAADVNKTNDRGQTPLAGSVFKKDRTVARLLLQNGADVNAGTPSAAQTAEMFEATDLLS